MHGGELVAYEISKILGISYYLLIMTGTLLLHTNGNA